MDNQSVEEDNNSDVHTTREVLSSGCLDTLKRIYILLLAGAAIAFSILVVFSCEFFSYRSLDDEPWEGLAPPFDNLTQAGVGLFSYSAALIDNGIEIAFRDGECVLYDDPLSVGQTDLWKVAQYSAMVAPAAALLAWIQLILEMVLCRLKFSFLFISLLLFAASALQGCTFMLFADREFCFNAASQNQCRLNSGAWFSMAATVSYLILAILCTSLDVYVGHTTKCFCCVMTKDWRREPKIEDIESMGEENEKKNVETSVSSADEQNWRDALDEDEDIDDDDFGQSNMAVDSNLSGMQWKATDESKDEEEGTQSSSMLQNPDTDLVANSNSVESENAQDAQDATIEQSESDLMLNKNSVRTERKIQERKLQNAASHTHTFPRKPDFLDVCCAGDPLEVEKHLEYPVKLQKSKNTNLEASK